MRKKLGDIFKQKRNVTIKEEDVEDISIEKISIEDILKNIKIIVDDNDAQIRMDNCDHDWIDYDEALLKNKAKNIKEKKQRQLDRILIKALDGPLDELDNKMLEMIMVYTPNNNPKVPGKCMMCNKEITVMNLHTQNVIIY